MSQALEPIVRGRHPDPAAVLGPHPAPGGRGVVVRVLRPGAKSVTVLWNRKRYRARWIHGDGLLEAHLPDASLPLASRYRVRTELPSGETVTEHDAYAFDAEWTDADFTAFGAGRDFRIHERLGAHVCRRGRVKGTRFAVWAPHAQRVSVVGSFNDWSGRGHGMRRIGRCGVWELFVPGVSPGALYKFEIRTRHGGRRIVKADPVARASELPPNTASIVVAPPALRWSDGAWVRSRPRRQAPDRPMSVYELHAGSWRRARAAADSGRGDGRLDADEAGRWLSWDELTASLIPHVKELGFTHVELMPVTEHPFDGSWGYQTTGYFAPTARFGDGEGLRRFVNAAHRAGIGVLLDWVPAHFPRDAHGPAFFDGTHLYEHQDPMRRVHPDWETFVFDWSRGEVQSFLISSALYWMREFHMDGLRVDAVASMLYLDYSRKPGQWRPNAEGGRENWDAVAFLRTLNDAIHERAPGAVTCAEESTAWPGVTTPTADGGLGFDLKWNMGWMNDTLSFFRADPALRERLFEKLTFSLTYAFSERYLLPLSHDEVVHGKASLLAKMPGSREEHFANLRTLYGLMWAHPGRKLLFMGGELAPWTEWNHDAELEWDLLRHDGHRGMREWVGHLNALYLGRRALHASDDSWSGFEWIDFSDPERGALAFLRRAPGASPVVVVANLSRQAWTGWRLGVPAAGRWRAIAHSEDRRFDGSGKGTLASVAEEEPRHGQKRSLRMDVPPLSVAYWARARNPK